MIAGDLNQAIIGAGPDGIGIFVGSGHRIDNAAARHFGHRVGSEDADAGRHFRVFARQIGTDDLPALPSVRGLKEDIGTEIENVRIDRREEQGSGAQKTILAGPHRLRGDILHLTGGAVVAGDLAAVNEVRMERIRGHVAVFFHTNRMPFPKGDLPIRAAADDGGRAALLLAAINPIRKLVIGADMIKLGGGLIVP